MLLCMLMIIVKMLNKMSILEEMFYQVKNIYTDILCLVLNNE